MVDWIEINGLSSVFPFILATTTLLDFYVFGKKTKALPLNFKTTTKIFLNSIFHFYTNLGWINSTKDCFKCHRLRMDISFYIEIVNIEKVMIFYMIFG